VTRSTLPGRVSRVHRLWWWAAGACVLAVTAAGVLTVPSGPRADEVVHMPQVRRILAGSWEPDPRLTTWPTYHALVAGVMWLSGAGDLPPGWPLRAARLVSGAFGTLLLGAYLLLLLRRLHRPGSAAVRWVQLTYLPVLLPYLFLVYTDATGLLLVVAAVALAERPRPVLAPLAALGAVLVRQSNLVWAGYALMVQLAAELRRRRAAAGESPGGVPPDGVRAALPSLAAHAAPYAAIAANVYFFLFVLLVCFLPLLLPALVRVLSRCRERPRLAAALGAGIVVGFPLFAWSFEVDHPYNQLPGSVRNALLGWFSGSWGGLVVLYAAVVLAAVALAATPLVHRAAVALAPLGVLFLASHWLVEQRYYFVPLALWLAYREDAPRWAERLQLAYGIPLGLFTLVGFARGWFFL
jgi:alpha-1,2-glucosyltransferase